MRVSSAFAALYLLALLPLFSSGHLVGGDLVQAAVASSGLLVLALGARRRLRLSTDGYAILVVSCGAFVVTRFDPLLLPEDTYRQAGTMWFLSASGLLTFTMSLLALLHQRRRSAQSRLLDLLVLSCCGLVSLLVLIASPASSAGERWVAVTKIAQLLALYFGVSRLASEEALVRDSVAWRSLPGLLVAFAVGIGGAAALGGVRLHQAESFLHSGRELLQADAVEAGIRDLEEAARLSNWSNDAILASLAGAYGAGGRESAALDLLRRVDWSGLDREDTKLQIASAYERIGRTNEAVGRLQEMRESDAAQRMLLGLFLRTENSLAARELLAKMPTVADVELAPPELHLSVARILMDIGRPVEAEVHLKRAEEAHVEEARLRQCEWHAAADPNAGLVCLRGVLERDPSSVEGWYQMGRAQERAGDPRSAVEAYRRALQLDAAHLRTLDRVVRLAEFEGAAEQERWKAALDHATTRELPQSLWPRGGEMPENNAYSLATALPSGRMEFVIQAAGTPASGEYPHLNVSLLRRTTGQLVPLGSFHVTESFTGYVLQAELQEAGEYMLRVHFDNDGVRMDAEGRTIEDRNAFLGAVSIRPAPLE